MYMEDGEGKLEVWMSGIMHCTQRKIRAILKWKSISDTWEMVGAVVSDISNSADSYYLIFQIEIH